jgi:hypothetical protein
MRYRSLLVVPLCLACVAVGTMLNRPATGQDPLPRAVAGQQQHPLPFGGQQQLPPPENASERKPVDVRPVVTGRYQVAIGGGNYPYAVVVDTATGHSWLQQAGGDVTWHDMGTPGDKK